MPKQEVKQKMTLAVTPERLKEMLEETKNQIDDAALYFELKKRKLIRGNQSLENTKVILAMVKLHIPITAYSLNWATGRKGTGSALSVLHTMGDKNLLLWKRQSNLDRGSGNPYEWIISPYLADLMSFVWRKS